MVALTLILEIVAVALGVILVTGGVVLDNQVKKMLDEGVCDALRIDDQFDDLEKSNRTEEYNLTNSKTDEYHTLYSWTDFGAFRSGNSDAIPLKRYTYKMQEICNDYEYEISSIDGVDTYSYKEWCYKRFTDETKEQMQNDIIYTVNPVYATVMSPYGIGSELVFALGVGDQSFQAAFPVLYDDTTLLGIGLSMIPSYLTRFTAANVALGAYVWDQWNGVNTVNTFNGTTMAAYYTGQGDPTNAYYSNGWELGSTIPASHVAYLFDATFLKKYSLLTGATNWGAILNGSTEAQGEFVTEVLTHDPTTTSALAQATMSVVSAWMYGRVVSPTGEMLVSVCLDMGHSCAGYEDAVSAQILNGSLAKHISGGLYTTIAELGLSDDLNVPFEAFVGQKDFAEHFTATQFSALIPFLTNASACTLPGVGDISGASCFLYFNSGPAVRAAFGLGDFNTMSLFMSTEFENISDTTGINFTVEGEPNNAALAQYISFWIPKHFVLDPAAGLVPTNLQDSNGFAGDIGGGIMASSLFIKRTAYELFFGWNDALTATLGLTPFFPGLIGEQFTTLSAWKAAHPNLEFTVITTGCEVGRFYLSYQGAEAYTTADKLPERTECFLDATGVAVRDCKVWEEPENITGSSPGKVPVKAQATAPEQLEIWVEQIGRVARFINNGTVDVKGITCTRFRLDEDYLLTPSPIHGNTPGSQPIGAIRGAPLYATMEGLLFIDETQRGSFTSDSENGSDWIQPMSTEDYYARFEGVYLDVEPNLGATLRGRKALGGAVKLQRDSELGVFSAWYWNGGAIQAVQTVPIFERVILGLVDDDDAADIRNNLDTANAVIAGSIACMAVGAAMFAAGGGHVFFIRFKARKNKTQKNRVTPDNNASEKVDDTPLDDTKKEMMV